MVKFCYFLVKIIFRCRNCFLSSGAMDGHGLNLKKWGLNFQSFNAMPSKVSTKGLHDEIFYETLLDFITIQQHFSIWVKTSAQN